MSMLTPSRLGINSFNSSRLFIYFFIYTPLYKITSKLILIRLELAFYVSGPLQRQLNRHIYHMNRCLLYQSHIIIATPTYNEHPYSDA